MKKIQLISFLTITVFILICSCSTEGEDTALDSPTQYTLTVSASDGGSVSPAVTGIYNDGATVTITANDSEGCLQRDLLGLGGARGKSRCIIKMNSNREVEAFFQKKME